MLTSSLKFTLHVFTQSPLLQRLAQLIFSFLYSVCETAEVRGDFLFSRKEAQDFV